MAKFYGFIGFSQEEETRPGVYEEQIVEYPYFGDVIRSTKKWENGEGLNDNFNIRNDISIVADSFAREHVHLMRYVTYCGTKWKISSCDVQYPRLVLSIGGVYNEQSSEIT